MDERNTPNAQIVVLLAAFAALIATLITGQPESQGLIAFVSSRHDPVSMPANGDLYLMNADGTNVRRLTQFPSWQLEPAWSPDGRYLAFTSREADGIYLDIQIHLMDVEVVLRDRRCHTTMEVCPGVRRLTNSLLPLGSPNWSPDGQWIVYESGIDQYEIFIVSFDGTEIRQLTQNDVADRWPSWSPDGDKIVYSSVVEGRLEIFVMGVDGQNPTQLTRDVGGLFPAWSRDGAQIAFAGYRNNRGGIYLMDADGQNQRVLVESEGSLFHPTWSRDGQYIVYEATYSGGSEIFVVDTSGENVRRLTNNGVSDLWPAWQP
jgi:Tol biopolymer transport system component